MAQKSVVARIVTVSEGATFRVQRIELTPEGTAMLTTGLTHGIPGLVKRPRDGKGCRPEVPKKTGG